jgi:hypothetical protein
MNFEHDEECGAAPGVMGHLACTNRHCSCCEREPVEECNRKLWHTKEYVELYAKPERHVLSPAILDFERIVHSTEKATLFALPDGREQWVPKSQILSIDNNCVTITGWFAEKIV